MQIRPFNADGVAWKPTLYRVVAAAFTLISVGCASTVTQEPAWPAQPTPAYPTASASPAGGETRSPSAQLESPAEAPEPTSQLAKKYDGKASLDTLEGKATYYADSLAGNHTANGDIYDPGAFTAAHKKLPFGTILRVIRQDSRATTYVKVNDRGPFGPSDRIIDLSKAAAKELGMLRAGVVAVRLEVVERPSKK